MVYFLSSLFKFILSVCVIIWQTLKLPYISEVMLGGGDPMSLS